jgi:hypothetical protein
VRAAWDDSWTKRLTAKHRAVFDSPEIQEGLALSHAVGYVGGMRDVLGAPDREVQAVVVIRHAAIQMAFNDAMWQKYELGAELKIKASGSDAWVLRNPFLDDAPGSARPADQPRETLAWLLSHGHIVVACDRATRRAAGQAARRVKAESRAVYDEFVANLVPGVILQPTGVYAALRAQEVGCSYIRST